MSRYHSPVTPAEIGSELAKLCTILVSNSPPCYVSVHPESGAPTNECFSLVDVAVARFGGARLLGWTLWELPGVFVEAEFHAVWESPTGALIDIAPKNRSVERILFLPNKELTYTGRQVNNVRRPLSAARCVAEYLATFDAEFELLNRGARAQQHGKIELTGSEVDEYASLQQRRAILAPEVLALAAHIGAYTPCPCNSGKKVKWCHRHHLG